MGKTAIEWTSTTVGDKTYPGYTFNPWWGCVKISPACKNCYAATLDNRMKGGEHWGPDSERMMMSDSYWQRPLGWNSYAKKIGVRLKVFCASMADVFEDRPDLIGPRDRLFRLIEETPYLNWLLLTKRPENILSMLPRLWYWITYEGRIVKDFILPDNVWIGTTAENQKYLIERVTHLAQVPAKVIFISGEPLLGPLDMNARVRTNDIMQLHESTKAIHEIVNWVIAGGESGHHARMPDYRNFLDLQDQCEADDIPFFFKQWGEWAFVGDNGKETTYKRVGKAAAGNLLDGREWKQMPTYNDVIA